MALFPPPDNPDWYRQTEFAGQPLFTGLGLNVPNGDFTTPTDILVEVGAVSPLYVGNWPSISLTVYVTNGGTDYFGWGFNVAWWGQPGPTNEIANEQYWCDTTCTIQDSLPVLAPYVSFQWFTVGPALPGVGGVQVFGGLSGIRGASTNPNPQLPSVGGAYINQAETTLLAGTSLITYSPLLTPGWHWAYLEADEPAGHAGAVDVFCQLELSVEDTAQSIVAQALPVDVRTIYANTVMIPNIQPRIRWINDNAATINIQGHLLRAKV